MGETPIALAQGDMGRLSHPAHLEQLLGEHCVLKASHGRGHKDSRLSHFAGDTQVTHPVLASWMMVQRLRALGRTPRGLSVSLSGSHSKIFSVWPLSNQYQEWPCCCCAQEAMSLISWSLSPCFLELSISRYLSKN